MFVLKFETCFTLLMSNIINISSAFYKQFSRVIQLSFSTLVVSFVFFNTHGLVFECEVAPWSNGSVLDHRSLSPVFESRHGHI